MTHLVITHLAFADFAFGFIGPATLSYANGNFDVMYTENRRKRRIESA